MSDPIRRVLSQSLAENNALALVKRAVGQKATRTRASGVFHKFGGQTIVCRNVNTAVRLIVGAVNTEERFLRTQAVLAIELKRTGPKNGNCTSTPSNL
jgi:hypothetical protein